MIFLVNYLHPGSLLGSCTPCRSRSERLHSPAAVGMLRRCFLKGYIFSILGSTTNTRELKHSRSRLFLYLRFKNNALKNTQTIKAVSKSHVLKQHPELYRKKRILDCFFGSRFYRTIGSRPH
jgi:hypothetical protein